MSPKRKPTPPEPVEAVPVEPLYAEPANADDTKPKKDRKGVYIPFNDDGSIDYKRLRGETWKLDEARRALGAVDVPGGSGMQVSDDFVHGLYKAFEFTLSRVGLLLLKWPAELCEEMRYTPVQIATLVPPTKTVLEKFAPKWLTEHQELAAFAVIFATETTNMVQGGLRTYVRKHPEVFQPKAPVKPNGESTREGLGATEPQ